MKEKKGLQFLDMSGYNEQPVYYCHKPMFTPFHIPTNSPSSLNGLLYDPHLTLIFMSLPFREMGKNFAL